MTASRIYVGHVVHRRLRPRTHVLRYRCFWLLLDLAELPALDARLRLFAHNRPAAIGFHDRDHGDGSGAGLLDHVAATLAAAGIDWDGGPVRLLCMPRVVGYGFNPLSVYFCYGRNGSLRAALYEVSNTFGERHSYVARADPGEDGVHRHHCDKRFFVSPFLATGLAYDFRLVPPADGVSITIRTRDDEGPVLLASLAGRSRPLTDAALAGLLVRQPFLTLKVVAAIHWEALRLWLKGVPLQTRPPPADVPITIARPPATPATSARQPAPPLAAIPRPHMDHPTP